MAWMQEIATHNKYMCFLDQHFYGVGGIQNNSKTLYTHTTRTVFGTYWVSD